MNERQDLFRLRVKQVEIISRFSSGWRIKSTRRLRTSRRFGSVSRLAFIKRLGFIKMPKSQSGQAMVEALLVLLLLASLWAGILWLGRLQDIGLQLTHASRRAAFSFVHQGQQHRVAGLNEYLAAPGHFWGTRTGKSLLSISDEGTQVHDAALSGATGPKPRVESFDQGHGKPLPLQAYGSAATATISDHMDQHLSLKWYSLVGRIDQQAGDPVPGAQQWREELANADGRVWLASVSAVSRGTLRTEGRLHDFDTLMLRLVRHTAIMRGSGAAASDQTVQQKLASSQQAWERLASVSRRAGQDIERAAKDVDMGWGRAQPEWNWLNWAGSLPNKYLQRGRP